MMKRILALFTAALMTTAAAPVLAQNANDSGSTSNMNGDTTPGGKTTNTDQMKNQMGASGSMMPMADVTTKLQTMTEVSSVEVVNTSDMANTDHSTGDATPPVNTTAEEQESLQTAIMANPAINDELEAQGVDPSQVVAANVDANNKVTVYVK